nr:junctophilin-3 [Oryctolagus cuniculus]
MEDGTPQQVHPLRLPPCEHGRLHKLSASHQPLDLLSGTFSMALCGDPGRPLMQPPAVVFCCSSQADFARVGTLPQLSRRRDSGAHGPCTAAWSQRGSPAPTSATCWGRHRRSRKAVRPLPARPAGDSPLALPRGRGAHTAWSGLPEHACGLSAREQTWSTRAGAVCWKHGTRRGRGRDTRGRLPPVSAQPSPRLLSDPSPWLPAALTTAPPPRTSHSRAKAEAALTAAQKAQEEARIARITAKEFSPSFQHRENGLECQRPKHQLSCEEDIEVLSAGAPLQQESPGLYRKGTTPSDLTPDDSPLQSFPASPAATPPPAPASRNKVAHFSRQVSVDEERGGDIQVLLEGRGGDYARGGWGEEKAGGPRGVRGGALRSSQPAEDLRARGSGHRQPGNPKPRERRTESPPTFSWTPHSAAGGKLLERDEERLSNYKLEMRPLLRMQAPPQRRRCGRGAAGEPRPDDRGFGVQRLRPKPQNKESLRPASAAEPTVQKLESLRLGARAEPRLLRWDLTFSPPQKSLPVALESDDENGDELKSSAGSAPVLVAMVILLNIGVAILFINFFI